MDRPYDVGPGWWHLLDLEIPQLYEIDPGLTDLEITEKNGVCQVDCWPSEAHKHHVDMLADVASAIESQSAIICENCGEYTGVKSVLGSSYCNRCAGLSPEERRKVEEEAVARYHRTAAAKSLFGILPTEGDGCRE